MAGRLLLRPRTVVPIATLTAGLILFPKSSVHAESPPSDSPESIALRKPIYDNAPPPPSATPSLGSEHKSGSPSPTERLAVQIAHTRMFLHGYAAAAEDKTNDLLTRAFNLEHSFTSTIASLAPPRTSSERVMPGGIYVLVAAMGSSILVRNRNILLRATVPLAVGIAAGWYVIPITMRNVGDLMWTYEEKFPVVADTHLRIRDRVSKFVETGVAHSKMSAGMLEDKVGEAREKVEEWVRKGK